MTTTNYNFRNGYNKTLMTESSLDFDYNGLTYVFNYVQDETGSADGDTRFDLRKSSGRREFDVKNPFTDKQQFESFKEAYFDAEVETIFN